MSNESSLFFVFDVESVGLYGEGFAVGWTVVDLDGKEHDSGIYSTSPFNVRASKVEPNAMEWVKKNCPEFEKTSNRHFCLSFWDKLQQWWVNSPVSGYKDYPKVCTFWADWASPVEATFLEKVAAEAYYAHLADDVLNAVPAPLHEIATLQLAAGITDDLPRLPSELPEHNPLNDARHSARKLVRAMVKLKQLSGSGFNVEQYNNPGVPTAPVFCHYGYKIVGQTKTWVFHSMRECTPDVLEDELRRAREMEPEQDYQIVQLFCVKNWNDLRVRTGQALQPKQPGSNATPHWGAWSAEFPKQDGWYWVKKPGPKIIGPLEIHSGKLWLSPFVGYPWEAISNKQWQFLPCDPEWLAEWLSGKLANS